MSTGSPPQHQIPSPARTVGWFVLFAFGAFGLAFALLAVLHLDSGWGGIDPVTAMLSDYALRPGWWMWVLALVLTSAGSVTVWLALRRQGVLRGGVTTFGMGVWWVSVLLVAVFTKDPQGGAITATGKVHLFATATSSRSAVHGGPWRPPITRQHLPVNDKAPRRTWRDV